MKGLVCGIGINDIMRTTRVIGVRNEPCPFQIRWRDTLKRCYSEKYLEKHPTYRGCYFVDEWIYASNFKNWMEQQDWKDKQLDKDILFPGNKVYGPDTCVFVSQEVNKFVTQSEGKRGLWPIGVTKTSDTTYTSRCNVGDGVMVHLGTFKTPELAHEAWLSKKLELAYLIAAKQSDDRVAKALIARYENYKEVV